MDVAHEKIGNERAYVIAQLRAAGLLVEEWDDLDRQIAELEVQGITPLDAPVELPPGARPSERLIDEDRGR